MINPATDTDDFYSTQQVAAYFKCHIRTVRRWVDEGRLTAIQPSRKQMITRQSVVMLIKQSRKPIY